MNFSKTESWLAGLLVSGLFVYVLLRALLIPITYDEAATFYHYINLGLFWPGTAVWDANNHILNSMLSIASFRAFGSSEIALRLPNVLAGLLYLIMAVKLSSLVSNSTTRWALLLALCCNHFVLEFLAVSRGYGISMGLLLLALFHLYKWLKQHNPLHLGTALLAMQLATLANLSLLVLNLLMFTWVLLFLVIKVRKSRVLAIAFLVAAAASIKWFIDLSFLYKEKGLLYYGSGDGFWDVTAMSLSKYAFPATSGLFQIVLVVLLVGATLMTLMTFRQKQIKALHVFPYLFFVSVVGNFLMNQLLGVNYPEDRVAMHYLVLLPVCIAFVVETQRKSNLIAARISLVLMLIVPVNFALSANLSFVGLWKEDACAKQFYTKVLEHAEESGQAPTVAGYYLRDLPFYYYNYHNNAELSIIQDEAFHGDEADFLYAFLEEDGKWDSYEIIDYNKAADLHLLKAKKPRRKRLWVEKKTPAMEVSTEPYYGWYEADVDSMVGKDLLWVIEVEMPELKKPFQAWITTDIGTPDGRSLMQETVVLDRLKPKWEQGETLKQQIMLANIPEEASHIKLFFWNIKQEPIALGEVSAALYELVPNE